MIESSSGLRLRVTNKYGSMLAKYCVPIAAARATHCQSCLLAEFDDSESGLSLDEEMYGVTGGNMWALLQANSLRSRRQPRRRLARAAWCARHTKRMACTSCHRQSSTSTSIITTSDAYTAHSGPAGWRTVARVTSYRGARHGSANVSCRKSSLTGNRPTRGALAALSVGCPMATMQGSE